MRKEKKWMEKVSERKSEAKLRDMEVRLMPYTAKKWEADKKKELHCLLFQ